ncbi:hypothetical protein M7784_09430 [Desulfovibrio aminophilus]|nr:hypothetical protein [Desulfovibrio aminophilus]MCM0755467.1 hypothetical protein [Desulfovibrio aminophilus]
MLNNGNSAAGKGPHGAAGVILALALLLLAATSARAEGPQYCTGTFSNMRYVQAGNDLIGMEVRIVLGERGFKAMIQSALGTPGDPVLVDAQIKGQAISFDVPAGRNERPGRFQGTITDQGISGALTYENGGQIPLNLPRRTSYWDDQAPFGGS